MLNKPRITITISYKSMEMIEHFKKTLKGFNVSSYVDGLILKSVDNPLVTLYNEYCEQQYKVQASVKQIRKMISEYEEKGIDVAEEVKKVGILLFEDVDKLKESLKKDKLITDFQDGNDKI